MCVGFILLACSTALDVLAHKLRETRPPEFRGDELASLQITGVAGSLVVVAAGKDRAAEGVFGGNVDATFVGQDVIVEFPVREARPEGGRDVFQGRL